MSKSLLYFLAAIFFISALIAGLSAISLYQQMLTYWCILATGLFGVGTVMGIIFLRGARS